MDKNAPKEIFTSLDLEMNQPSGKIISIGAVVGNIKTGEILDRLHIFVNPRELISPYITELTKIKQSDVDSAGTLEEGYNQLKEMHLKYQSYLTPITWGGGDTQELFMQLKEENPEFQGWCFGRRWIDAKTLFISWRISNGQPLQGGLAKCMTKVGLKFFGQKHKSVDDAENTFKIYLKLLELLKVIKADTDQSKYWLEVDPETGNPTGEACWAYFKDDKPTEGNWLLVKQV